MTRRRLVALVSALTLVALGLVVLVALLSVTRTTYGRDKVRAYLESRIASRVKGRVHIGRITGGLLGGVRIDTLEIRDSQDSLFFASGPLTVSYDIRDFFDRRVLLERLEVERPVIRLDQTEEGEWNYRRIFPRAQRRLPQIQGGLGDFIVADNVVIRDGTLILRLPWHPADSLTGARRDSAITVNLARRDADIARRPDGLVRTRRWMGIDLVSNLVRWADPDSIGRHIDIRSLAARESDPPVEMTDAQGYVRTLGDSLWLELSSFDITASTGSANGKIVWGSRLPTRYDVEIKGDSVSLGDVAWVYPTLPRTGTGSMRLHIRSRRENPRVIDYAITDMDVRTTGSRLRGDMTFGVGGPVLEVTDVALDAQPVDFRLIETLSGDELPVPWAGTIRGTARGPGGPVTRFVVDEAQMTFADANVPGAVSRATGGGGLDILYPSLTKFQGFAVDVGQLDLRTIEFLFPNFPRLGGTVTGRATLDSSWLDVRFREADVTHVDGPAPPTRFTGSGRVTYGDPFLAYDVDLVADSLSFTSLARSYPNLPLRGSYAGPIRARGTTEALDVTATLSGGAGRMAFDGRVDAYPPGYAARGRASVTDMNVARLLERADLPETRISAQFEGDLTGDSLANVVGLLAFDTDRSRIAEVTLRRPTSGRLRFGDGRVSVVELVAASDRFTVSATGALGLAGGVRDSMHYRLVVDSLGSLRPWLKPLDSARIAEELPEDSLGGSLRLDGYLAGNLDRLDLFGDLRGADFVFGQHRARAATGRVALADMLGARTGNLRIRLDTVIVGDRRLDSLEVSADLADADRGRVAIAARAADFDADATAAFRIAGDTTDLLVDSVRVFPHDGAEWRLRAPARVVGAGAD
jgi:translocation and assembly module TamB